MKNHLKKEGVMLMLLSAITMGALIGLFSTSLLVVALTLVILVACVIVSHYLITKKIDEVNRTPVEVMILLFADIVFGLYAGFILGVAFPAIEWMTALVVAICGITALYILAYNSNKAVNQPAKPK